MDVGTKAESNNKKLIYKNTLTVPTLTFVNSCACTEIEY